MDFFFFRDFSIDEGKSLFFFLSSYVATNISKMFQKREHTKVNKIAN